MVEFSQNCLGCTTNSLSTLNDTNSNSNLRCGNSAHNVSNCLGCTTNSLLN